MTIGVATPVQSPGRRPRPRTAPRNSMTTPRGTHLAPRHARYTQGQTPNISQFPRPRAKSALGVRSLVVISLPVTQQPE